MRRPSGVVTRVLTRVPSRSVSDRSAVHVDRVGSQGESLAPALLCVRTPHEVVPWCAADRAADTLSTSGPAGVGSPVIVLERSTVGSVIKKRRKRMAKKKHRKLLKKTRVQRRRLGK